MKPMLDLGLLTRQDLQPGGPHHLPCGVLGHADVLSRVLHSDVVKV